MIDGKLLLEYEKGASVSEGELAHGFGVRIVEEACERASEVQGGVKKCACGKLNRKSTALGNGTDKATNTPVLKPLGGVPHTHRAVAGVRYSRAPSDVVRSQGGIGERFLKTVPSETLCELHVS